MSTSTDPRVGPWRIDESDFYEIEDARGQAEFLLRYAVLAPSGHNTQPWSFHITSEGVEVYADLARRLPIADPANRELLISVGAAITNFRVAAAHFGFDTTVLHQNESVDNGPAALIALRETCDSDPSLRALFPSILARRTNRSAFERRPIEPETLDRLCTLVDDSETTRFILPHERPHLAELVQDADRWLLADPAWRGELAEWVRTNESNDADGITADAFGIPGPLSAFAPWLLRNFDVGEERGRADRALTENAAGLIVLSADDDRTSLVRAGEALERLLLHLTGLGVQYAFLNQPIQVPRFRRELWNLIRTPKPPQMLLRIGYGSPVRRAAPRRPVTAVKV